MFAKEVAGAVRQLFGADGALNLLLLEMLLAPTALSWGA